MSYATSIEMVLHIFYKIVKGIKGELGKVTFERIFEEISHLRLPSVVSSRCNPENKSMF